MATELSGSMRLILEALMSRDYGITGDKAVSNLSLTSGIVLAVAAADELFHDDGSIADGAFPTSFQNFDLQTILDPHGTAINLTAVRFIVALNTTAAGGAGLVFGDPTGIVANIWEGWHKTAGPADNQFWIAPQAPFLFADPAGNTIDATHKIIRLTHDSTGAAAATYEIAVVGKKV